MDEAYANIDVQFKKRADLLPNILTIAKRFMVHEKTLLKELTELRTSVMELAKHEDSQSVQKRFDLENTLEQKMQRLILNVENYPELHSQELLLQAQENYADVETNLAAARRNYNSAVSSLRNAIEIFPGNILNALFVRAVPKPMYEVSEHDKREIHAEDYLD